MSHELYKRYRPTLIKHLVGQDDAVKVLKGWIAHNEIPHAVLLTGPSGCGKTTIARILKAKVGCSDSDFKEINAADFRGVDMIRDIRRASGKKPFSKARMWLIDEAHGMTKDAQNAFLKLLEDTPQWVYYALASTDPNKLLKTIHTRCSTITLKSIGVKAMRELVLSVCQKEKVSLPESVTDKIVECAEGSARQALVDLGKVIRLESEKEMLAAVTPSETYAAAMELVNSLMPWKGIPDWPKTQAVLKKMPNVADDLERLRQAILTIAANAVVGAAPTHPRVRRAYLIIQAFRDPFFDSKRAGLVAACYEVFTSK